jgi:hypothetical protein
MGVDGVVGVLVVLVVLVTRELAQDLRAPGSTHTIKDTLNARGQS